MTEKTKLIRGILDAATADNLAEAERLIDEYTGEEILSFFQWDFKQTWFYQEPSLSNRYLIYLKEKQ
jgi:hypothetical protein